MRARLARWLAWCMWVVTLAMIVVSVLFESVNVGADPLAINLLGALVLLAYATVGVLIASRQPRNSIGWLLLGSATLSTLGDLGIEYGVYGLVTHPGVLPVAALVAAIGEGLRTVGFSLILTFLLLLFPTGRLPSPRWKPLGTVTLVAIILFGADNLLSSDLSSADTRLASVVNPLAVLPAASVAGGLLTLVSLLLIFGCALACCASVVVRFRRARGIERQQLKWLAYAAIWAAIAFAAAWIGVFINNSFLASAITFDLCMVGIPIAVGIAILRHRLYDIDVIINRTLVYGTLTLLLAAVYFASVIGMQQLARVVTSQQASNNPLVIVLSTLLIAALFQPLRRRVQRTIDHNFYRSRYDAAKTLELFAASLRSEIELTELREHLLAAVDSTMRPAHVSLWLRSPERR
ncbi:MAG TPA: hypothetical protein VFU88_13185 [Ktedonobacterales bacterium]|nr:hypothetical protein [Ktedonobacterales bacterium]